MGYLRGTELLSFHTAFEGLPSRGCFASRVELGQSTGKSRKALKHKGELSVGSAVREDKK